MKKDTGSRATTLRFLLLTALMVLLIASSASAANQIRQASKHVCSGGEWVTDSRGLRYRKRNGNLVRNKWVTIGGKVYCFNKKGYARTGWFTWQKKTYYAGEDGAVVFRKMIQIGKKTYYFRANGEKAVNTWVKLKGKYYRLNKNGVLLKNRLFSVNGKLYFSDGSGARLTKTWVTVDGMKYYFNKYGVMTKKKFADGTPVYLFVGDSRVVGMDAAVNDAGSYFIGKVSMGYSWLSSSAGSQVRAFLGSHENVNVIFCFGINDLGNIASYISYYRQIVSECPKASFYFISVNPILEEVASTSATNAWICSFNARLKGAFGSQYIDTYSYLNGKIQSVDGIHYTSSTYRLLHRYVLEAIG